MRLRVDTNAGAHEEKSRIQSALNDEMKKSVELKGQLEVKSSELAGKTQEIVDLRNQILKLESLIPVSKPKKSNSVFDPIESTSLTPSSFKGKDGSTF